MGRIVGAASSREYFWEINRDAEEPLKAWFQEVKAADWATPHQVEAMYRNASIVGRNRIVFNIAGNKYRLIVKFNYPFRCAYIRFGGPKQCFVSST
ncbi:MAG: type II toxin-antitoxin system HigB family toxin [Proteobacteria bacterium]|nr:type II toxin-antitoxin system HigB family toxin [Pseudomonadota bacterium]